MPASLPITAPPQGAPTGHQGAPTGHQGAPAGPHGWRLPLGWIAEALRRQRALTLFGLLMWAAMLPTLVAWGLDDRTLRGVAIWAKPLKFMASIGLFALCTAWFVGLLPPAERASRGVRTMAGVLIGAASFEIIYITLQAARGVGSHFNFVDLTHVVLYQLMGVGAMLMTVTQLWLAWRIARLGRSDLAPVWRDAVVLGLALTFLLGAGAGGLLSAVQPPAGAGLPVVGWHLGGADLRPAHFLGMHAQQFLPALGLVLAAVAPRSARWPRVVLAVCTLAYVALWGWALAIGLDGAVFAPPMPASR